MRVKPLIGVTGLACSGKDTVAARLETNHNFYRSSFAAPLKTAVHFIVPPAERALVSEDDKTTTLGRLGKTRRDLLQLLGTEFAREMIHPDIWVFHMMDQWDMIEKDNSWDGLVISDVRFENEAEFILDHGGYILEVTRPGLALDESFRSHKSEAGLPEDFIYCQLVNDTTVEDLHKVVDQIVMEILDKSKIR